MADIGYFSLLLALVVSVYSIFAFVLGVRGKNPVLISSARNGLLAGTGLIS